MSCARLTNWTSTASAWTGPAYPVPEGPYTGPNPTDRGKLGSKRHLITDRQDIQMMFCVTAANRHDSVVFDELVDALPAVAGKPGRPRRWPGKLHADKEYDYSRCSAHLKRRGIKDRIARIGIERNDRLGRHRCGVERTHAWLAAFGKLRTRFERRIDIHVALLSLVCCVICLASNRARLNGWASKHRIGLKREA